MSRMGSRKVSRDAMEGVPLNVDEHPRFVVSIIEAKDVMKMDVIGNCDPYFVIKYGTQEATTTVKQNCTEATYNEDFDFLVEKGENRLEVIAWDKDMLKSDYFGKAVFDLQHVPVHGWVDIYNDQTEGKPLGCRLKLLIKFVDPRAPAHVMAKKTFSCWTQFSQKMFDLCKHPDNTNI
mmetsp:Transcript_30353/g.38934  ORF Transcript_30353/g.38934 Transcript_30353/m.38934 type:complete len:178 (-) Transcript_30353:81-614(-)